MYHNIQFLVQFNTESVSCICLMKMDFYPRCVRAQNSTVLLTAACSLPVLCTELKRKTNRSEWEMSFGSLLSNPGEGWGP